MTFTSYPFCPSLSSLEITFTETCSFGTIRSMGKAGKALREVLTRYGISQNSLAVKMGLQRSAIYKWFHEERDPTAETVTDIVEALKGLNRQAAEDFVQLYLGDMLKDDD